MLEAPFVLLDDAWHGGAPARLYRSPVRIVTADTPEAVAPALDALRAGQSAGLHAAGYLTYEAGAAFVEGVALPRGDGPLLWFGLFDTYEPVADVAALLPDPAGARAGAPAPDIDRAAYDERIVEILALIAAGDIYQANLTFAATVPHAGDPLALYARLRRQAKAGHAALVDTGAVRLLSLSPELFFALEGDALTCRPMKGTLRRVAGDDGAAALAADPKQCAENLMIVDLMRNDLARVAVPGSVAVPELFRIESYPSIHQMTSTVTATLAPGRDACDAVAALFPCGSITGAPKRRAMQVIATVEQRARGAYCGSIGRIDADGSARFNVAIRTLEWRGDTVRLGVGGGIVADSNAGAEWDEALAKAAFVTAGGRGFDLIETMAFDPLAGIALLERHVARMRASAEALGFVFDRHAARNELQAATFRLRRSARVRLLLAASGAIAVEIAPLPVPPDAPVEVAVVPLPVAAADIRLRHKTSDRGFYDAARIAAGTFEVVFETDGLLSEGSFTSLFVPRGDRLVTPPLTHGLLPGVLRAELIAAGRAVEGQVRAADLADGFFVGNAVRGLIPAVLAVAH
ncbi:MULTISPECIES: aminodeoxychorismate synthase component I [unclassified Sphingomonas]|uniref:aminodeoxychorismate synthase component I n=1 Tax=unclassified Sphingomonas TaxID=196159 RepID=UPI00226AF492|nr:MULTISPECIES: aminodeoxychorismate synthase component I [unclassified Sphingomonas]